MLFDFNRFATDMAWVGAGLALLNATAVAIERGILAFIKMRRQRIDRRYGAIAQRALGGDEIAVQDLAHRPHRHRIAIALMLIAPLHDDRDPRRVARTRTIVQGMSLAADAERGLRSPWWWRRALAVRLLGLLQITARTANIVAALDDDHPTVRAAALDSIADLRDARALMAIVVRLHDESLHHGHRLAALAAFGSEIEPLVLETADIDPANRLSYARALQICGTARSRRTLCDWTQDPAVPVRIAALQALGHVGLDAQAAPVAIEALEDAEVTVRAVAAAALRNWNGAGDVAGQLARHLDDLWPVAVQAAQSLRTMRESGRAALRTAAARPDLAGQLARQTLWDITTPC